MSNYVAKPLLGFGEALKLASGRLCDFNGRSRRSEFWWFALAYTIVAYVFTFLFTVIGQLFDAPLLATEIASDVFSLLMLAVLVRRLQDTGRSKWWAIGTWVLMVAGGIYSVTRPVMDELNTVNPDMEGIMSGIFQDPVNITLMVVVGILELVVFVFCLLDSKKEPNQYGESPKYVEE